MRTVTVRRIPFCASEKSLSNHHTAKNAAPFKKETQMLMDDLTWRYATKKMDPAKTVAAEKIETVLDAIRMAPTSSGLQPFEVLVITDPDIRAKLQDATFGQTQVTQSTALLVFAAWDDYTDARIDMVMHEVADARGGVTDMLEGYYSRLKDTYVGRAADVNFDHAARQAYIALGVGMVAAAEAKVDCTPMEGFVADDYDAILGLREKGLRTCVILPLGYRDSEGDWLVDAPKVRRDKAKLFPRLD